VYRRFYFFFVNNLSQIQIAGNMLERRNFPPFLASFVLILSADQAPWRLATDGCRPTP